MSSRDPSPNAPPGAAMQRRPSRRKSRSRRLVAGHGGANGNVLPEMEQFGRLYDKVTTSLKNLEYTRDFLRAMIDHAQRLQPLVTKFLDKQTKLNLRFSVVDKSIQDYWRNTAEYGVQMAAELQEHVLIPLDQFYAESKAKQKELNKENVATRKAFVKAQKEHSKQKQVCEREWQRLNTAIEGNDERHKRNQAPKNLRQPQERCSKTFMRMEDLTRNLNKLERDNHRQCCEIGKVLGSSQHYAAVRLKAHCDTAQYRADVLSTFTEKITPIVARKAPSPDSILWTWVSYPKNHHTGLPCEATAVLQKTQKTQRFEMRPQPDYQKSEFLNPPENAELPPGMRRVNVRATTPEPVEEKVQVAQEVQEQQERPKKKRRAREEREAQPQRAPEPEPGARGEGAAAAPPADDWGSFGKDDDWGTFDQTPGGPPPQAAQPPPAAAAPAPQASTDAFSSFGDGDAGFDDFGDFGSGFDDFDQAPAAAAPPPAQPATQPTAASKPPPKREQSVSAVVITASATDFDAFGMDDDGFGDEFGDFDEEFDSGFDNFNTPTASIQRPTSTADPVAEMPTSPFSQDAFNQPAAGFDDFGGGFDDFDSGFENSTTQPPPEESRPTPPEISAPTETLAPDEEDRRLDSPDPYAGGIVRFGSRSQLSNDDTQTGMSSGFDFEGEFESTTRDDDPFSSFAAPTADNNQILEQPAQQPERVVDPATDSAPDPFTQMSNGGAPPPAAAAVQPTPGGFDDDFDAGFGDFDSGFGGFDDVPVATSNTAVVSAAPQEPEPEPAPEQNESVFGDMMAKMQSVGALEETTPEPDPVPVAQPPVAAASTGFDDFGATPGFDDFGDFGDFGGDFDSAPAAVAQPPAAKIEPEPQPEPEPEPQPVDDGMGGMDDIFAQFAGGIGAAPAQPAPTTDLADLGFGSGFGTSEPAPAPAAVPESKPQPVVDPTPSQPAPAAVNPFEMLMGGAFGAPSEPSPLSAMFGAVPAEPAAPTQPVAPVAVPVAQEPKPQPKPKPKEDVGGFDDFNTPGGFDDDEWAF